MTDTARVTVAAASESAKVIAKVLEVLPDHRDRQARQFPVVTPDDPRIYFTWPHEDAPSPTARALDAILARIARIGHSSSVVSCRVVEAPATPPTWVPTDPSADAADGVEIRTTAAGLHQALTAEFARHRGVSERAMPAIITRYTPPGPQARPAARQTGLGDWLVMPLAAGQRLPLTRTQDLTRAVRGALMAHAAQPVSPVISGHSGAAGDPAPTEVPHMSVLALPNVSHVHSDGLIHAVAIGLPAHLAPDDRSAVLGALEQWAHRSTEGDYDLQLPGGRVYQLGAPVTHAATSGAGSAETGPDRRIASRRFWSRRAQSWSSVTPVALDRHPRLGKNDDYDQFNAAIAPLVEDMCRRVGLPPPVESTASPAAVWAAVPPVGIGAGRPAPRTFPQFRVGGRNDRRRFTTHLTIRFAEPVQGPIILGAGRFFGYGLFLPTPGGRGSVHDGD